VSSETIPPQSRNRLDRLDIPASKLPRKWSDSADLLPGWYAFRDARANRRAVEWLADNSLVDHDTVTNFLDEHPEPAVP
jgi:hypothetical protein